MTANKVRVQVRGSVGKSVRFPTNTGGAGATIGLDFRLPDGSVPTLQQLAAALVTGSAIQDQPGNIIPPGGGPTVIWQNIQYIPAPILNPPRYVHAEEEAGEEYHRMAVVGPIGPRGLQGIPGLRADDPEDPMPGPPGAAGAAGTAGSAGPPGAISAVHLWPDDPEDHISIPGSAGPPGNNGLQGAPGVISAVHLWPDDAEDPGLIPGAPGQAGVAGSPGPPGIISAVHLWPDDPEDPGLIPGASGPAGAAGAQGPAGVVSAVHLWPDDPEDMIHMPGVQGNVGAQGPAGVISAVHLWPDDPEDAGLIPGATGPVGPQGPAGSSSSSAGVGWAAYLDQDNYEDVFAHSSPRRIQLDSIDGAGPLIIRSASGAVDTLALDTPSGRFTTLLFNNAGTVKGQVYWDNTNTQFVFNAGNEAVRIKSTGAVQIPTSPLISTVTQAATGLANFVPASTSRTSTTALAVESGLSVTVNETGWYRVRLLVLTAATVGGAGGFKMDRNGGTATIANETYLHIISSSTGGFTATSPIRDLTTAPQFSTVVVGTGAPDWMSMEGIMQVTVAGTFIIRWAQVTSSANTTFLLVGSHIILTKIG